MQLWLGVLGALVGATIGLSFAPIAARTLRTPRPFSWWVPAAASVATGVLFGLVSLRFGVAWETPAYLFLSGIAVVLSIVDLAEKRLPNAIVYPSLGVLPLLLLIAAAVSDSWSRFGVALLGAVALFVLYFILALVSPSGIGMGDVKLSAIIGLALGYLGWGPVLIGGTAGFIIGGVISLVAVLSGRATMRSSIPFGPAMLAGAMVGILAA